MELSHEDIMDNAHSCQSFDYRTKMEPADPTLPKSGWYPQETYVAVGVCLKKATKGVNCDKARCGYGLNDQPPMRQCPNRVAFPREKEGKLVTV